MNAPVRRDTSWAGVAATIGLVAGLVASMPASGVDLVAEGKSGMRRARIGEDSPVDLAPGADFRWKSDAGWMAGAKFDFDRGLAQIGARAPEHMEGGEPETTSAARGYASVGFYTLEEGAERPSADSMLSVQVQRDPIKNRLILTMGGGLRTKTRWVRQTPAATFRVMVYPDLKTMEGDPAAACERCLFDAEATLGKRIVGRGGLAAFDFTRHESKDGIVTARLIGSVIRMVRVPDASTAVVHLIADVDKVVPIEADTTGAEETAPRAAAITMLWAPRPNPARRVVTFRFSAAHRLPARLVIYDLQGRRVSTLLDQVVDPGPHEVIWDPDRDRAKSGFYFARYEADDRRFTERFVVFR